MGLRRNRRRNLGTLITSVDFRLKDIERRPAPKRIMPKSITALLIDPEDATDIRDATSSSGTIISEDAPSPEEVNPGDSWLVPQEDGSYEEKVYAPSEEDETDFDAWKPLTNEAIAAAQVAAQAASTAANNSNRVFYQDDAPSNPATVPAPPGQTGTVSYSLRKNDLWFDTNDGNKPWKWDPDYIPNGQTTKVPQWVPATFGDGAIAGLNAGKITAGTLAAGVIYSGTVAADKILAGTLGAGVIATQSLTAQSVQAENITGSTITGKILRTSAGGNRVQIDTADEIQLFYNGTVAGTVKSAIVNFLTDADEGGSAITAARGIQMRGASGATIAAAGDSQLAMLSARSYTYSEANDATIIAALDDSGGNAIVQGPIVDLIGTDTYIYAFAEGTSQIYMYSDSEIRVDSQELENSKASPLTVNPNEGVYALGINADGSLRAVLGGGGGEALGSGYYNAQAPTEEGNKIWYNNSSSFPASAKAGDILIWYT